VRKDIIVSTNCPAVAKEDILVLRKYTLDVKKIKGLCGWLMSVFSDSWEAEIGRIVVQGQPGQSVSCTW
jgi:hypothetical protein